MGTPISQFNVATLLLNTDVVAGLRGTSPNQNDYTFPIIGIGDSLGANIITWTQGIGPNVNYIDFANNVTGLAPTISALGTDSNINLNISVKGTGHVEFTGVGAIGLPSGTTGQRPTGFSGGFRYNSTTDLPEYWSILNSAWESLAAISGVVTSINGTANQVAASASVGAVTLSTPNVFIAPGTIAAVTSISSPEYFLTGSGSGIISILPQAAAGTYNFNMPITAGTSGYLLTSAGGVGSPMTWTDPTTIGAVNSVSGTANRITVSPTTGAVVVDIAATYVGQASITTLGTITTGVWHGTAVDETHGGTNQTAYTLGDTLYASAANTLSKLSGNTAASIKYLSQTGTGVVSAAPVWAAISGGDITGAALTKVDDTNVTLTLGGTPTTALLRAASITAGWTGTLATTRGGTGLGSFTADTIFFASSTSAIGQLGPLTNGQLIIGSTGNAPVAATLTAGANITITNAAGGITIAASGGGGGSVTDVTATLPLISTGGATPDISMQGITTMAQGDLLYASATATFSRLAKDTNATRYLSNTGATNNPAWAQINLANGVTGVLPLANGGTNANLTASNGGIFYSTATAGAILAGTATASQVLLSGSSTTPAWSTATYPATTTINQLLYSSAANTIGGLATVNDASLTTNATGVPTWRALTDGQLIIGSSSGAPLAATLTAGANITITNAANSITIAASGSGGSAATKSIHQVAHGFSVQQVVYLNGTTYALAKADSVVTAEAVGMVTTVTDADNFILTISGYCSGLSGLTAGTVYWISDATAGLLTATQPTTVGNVQKPMFVADTTTSGYLINYRGEIIPTSLTLPVTVANGGTGLSSLTAYALLAGGTTSTGNLQQVSGVGAAGQVLTSAGASALPAWSNPAGLIYTGVSSNTVMVANNGYYLTGGGALTMTLPTTAAAGTILEIVGYGSTSWSIVQAAGQSVQVGTATSTVGVGGSVASTNAADRLRILCTTANLAWKDIGFDGFLTVT